MAGVLCKLQKLVATSQLFVNVEVNRTPGGSGVIKIWGPHKYGYPGSPYSRENGDPTVNMGTLLGA